jgi:hypothetical protein
VEETLFLLSVYGRATGVDVQDHPRGSLLDGTHKLLDEEILDFVQIPLDPFVSIIFMQARAQFNAIEGALASQALAPVFFSSALLSKDIIFAAGGSQNRIDPQEIMIIEVLVAGDQSVNSLPNQRQQIVLDEILIPSVLETRDQSLSDSKAPIQFPDQQTACVGGDAMAVHSYDHRP